METLMQDVRYGLRMLRKSPGFTAAAVVTLALGIGVNAVIFSAVYSVLLKPLPFDHPDRVLLASETWQGNRGRVSVGNLLDWQQQTTVFEQLAAAQTSSFNLAASESPERIAGERVTHNFFAAFGAQPLLGRTFTAEEDQPGRDRVLLIGERLWRRRFQSDASILGRTVRMDSNAYTVVGVMPAAFDPIQNGEELWVPIAFTPERRAQHDEHYLLAFGRLKPGVSVPQAQAEMDSIARVEAQRYPQQDGDRGAQVTLLEETLLGPFRPALYMLLGAVGFVLLIACANIGNLQLARSRGRSNEVAMRTALGASPGRIVRQLVVESMVLALAGGCAGLALAHAGLALLLRIAPSDVPRLAEATLDWRAVAFIFALTLFSGLLFGLWAALRVAFSRQPLEFNTGRGSAPAVRDRLRSALVVSEVALSLMLLAGAGLLIRSAWQVSKVTLGVDSSHLLIGRISLPEPQYADPERVKASFRRIVENVKQLPGLESVALVSNAPLSGANTNGLVPEGRPRNSASAINSRFDLISPGYFHAVRLSLKQGRVFTEVDRAGSPKVMVINETLARIAFPGQNPIGKRIACCELDANGQPGFIEVVGVVGDVHAWGLDQNVQPEFYLPMEQAPAAAWDWIQRSMDLVARGFGDPNQLTNALRASVSKVDPGVPLYHVETLDQRIASSLQQSRFNTFLMSIFAVAALLLAAIGLYGVLSYLVAQRTHEIGIRMAVGAQTSDVLKLVIFHGLRLVAMGVFIGLVGTLLTSHVLSSLLFGIRATDSLTMFSVASLLIGISLLASYIPARRAAKIDPMVALRYE